MYLIDASKFGAESERIWYRLIPEVKAGLLSPHRSVLIEKFGHDECNAALIRLASGLGRPHKETRLPGDLTEDEVIFRVESVADGIRDSRGVVLYSTTHAAFPSHTDGSGKPNPFDVVLLYCVRQDSCGGESTLVTLDELIGTLDDESIDTLRTKTFPVPFGLAPIICGHGQEMWIRYNAEELSFYSRLRSIEMNENQKKALHNLAATLSNLETNGPKIKMSTGQCLIIDNKRALHGRTAFSPNGQRLLKRLRLYWL
jgi:alpha-ketoglutarate-dependent taurine dioxygenase